MKTKTESLIQSEILMWLHRLGFIAVRINTLTKGFLRSYYIENTKKMAGFPDILALKNNQAILIEVKKEGGIQTPSQKEFEKVCKKTKCDYYIVKEAKEILKIIRERDLE